MKGYMKTVKVFTMSLATITGGDTLTPRNCQVSHTQIWSPGVLASGPELLGRAEEPFGKVLWHITG